MFLPFDFISILLVLDLYFNCLFRPIETECLVKLAIGVKKNFRLVVNCRCPIPKEDIRTEFKVKNRPKLPKWVDSVKNTTINLLTYAGTYVYILHCNIQSIIYTYFVHTYI